MSSYQRETKHPQTGEWEVADWHDDYFGSHLYSVKFSDGKIFSAADYKWETRRATPQPKEPVSNYMQVGEGHCFTCHKDTSPTESHTHNVYRSTPCTQACGKWFKEPVSVPESGWNLKEYTKEVRRELLTELQEFINSKKDI